MSDLPNYFEDFKHVRVPLGEVVPKTEMIRRVAHELQIPQVYGNRIITAYDKVIADAILHGEGISIKQAGTLSLRAYKTSQITVAHKLFDRTKFFKFRFKMNNDGRKYLKHITKFAKAGELESFLEYPQNYPMEE